MAGDVTPYVNLITSEHADKVNFVDMVGKLCQPGADLIQAYSSVQLAYDIDNAEGNQLDVLGQWIGVTRYLDTPLTGVYFSFDDITVGFDSGVWKGPFDPVTGLTTLPDDLYRILLKVKILNNQWDGSVEELYTLVDSIFTAVGYSFFVVDYADLSMSIGLVGSGPPSAVIKALLTTGKLDVKPAGIRIRDYIYQTVAGPIFAFDIDNDIFKGFDQAGWAEFIPA